MSIEVWTRSATPELMAHTSKLKAPRGMTLIEVVIALVLVSVLVITFAISLVAAVYARQVHYRNMAAALADEEIAALQTTGASQIPIQTNGSLLGVLFSQGN